jgi:crossover junction endonuclease MUS81
MKACPTTFSHPSEAQQLNGLGPKLCDRLTDKLKAYNAENGLPMPEKPKKAAKPKRSSTDAGEEPEKAPKKRKTQMYVPKQKSGAYAIVLALSTLDPASNNALSKADVIQIAQPYCDASFTVGTDTTKHYTAWASMKTLETKELVCTKGHPTKRYYLSDEGWETALACRKIAEEAGVALPGTAAHVPKQPHSRESAGASAQSTSLDSRPRPIDIEELDDDSEPRGDPSAARPAIPRRLAALSDADPLRSRDLTIVLPPDSFEILLVLDSREIRSSTDRTYISDELLKKGVKSITRALPLGDVVWVAKLKAGYADQLRAANPEDEGEFSTEVVLDYILERKRLDDLISSIKDGRFHEQKFRLRKSGVPNVTYLVEAFSISAERSETYGQSLETAITSTQVVNDIFVKQTDKLDESIKYLARMTQTLQKLYSRKEVLVVKSHRIDTTTYLSMMAELRKKHYQSTVGVTLSAFSSLCNKNDDLTLRDVYLKMLLCVRGVTADKAVEIQKIWPTPNALIEAYESCPSAKDRETMLSTRLSNAIPRKKVAKSLSTKIAQVWHSSAS